jgi:Fe-Mn family superoxide dismutase
VRGINSDPEAIAPRCATTAAATGTTAVLDVDGARAGGAPTGKIADAINGSFGSFDAFKEQWGSAAPDVSAADGCGC